MPEEMKQVDGKEDSENATLEFEGVSFIYSVVKTTSLISFEENERIINSEFGEEVDTAAKSKYFSKKITISRGEPSNVQMTSSKNDEASSCKEFSSKIPAQSTASVEESSNQREREQSCTTKEGRRLLSTL